MRAPSALIVEDDPELAATLNDFVSGLGYEVLSAENGQEALALLEAHTPGFLLVDLFMPVMGGVAFLRHVKESPRLRAIPRVIMTAANDRMVGVKEDAPVLYKPIDLDALEQILAQHLRPGPA